MIFTSLPAFSFRDDLRWPYLSLREERYGRKTRQRAPKPPFGNWLFIRGLGGETCGLFYVFALVQFTRFRPVRGVLRTVSTDSVVLLQLRRKRWHFKNNRRGVRSEVGWLRKSFVLAGHPHPKGTSYGDAEASPSGRSTQSAWKQCACARHARLNRVVKPVAKT